MQRAQLQTRAHMDEQDVFTVLVQKEHTLVRACIHTHRHTYTYVHTHTPHKLCYKSRFCIAGPAHSLFNERSIRVFLITLVEFDCVEMTMDQKGIPQGTRWGDVPDHRDVPIPVLKQNEK